MYKKSAIIAACCLATFTIARADSTQVNFDSGLSGTHVLADQNGTPLTGGNANVNGDGDVLQLGYYSAATVGNPFAGTWTPLSGQGSLNLAVVPGSASPNPITYNQTSIGDIVANGPLANGQYAITLFFDPADNLSNKNLPSGNPPLSIRFYNSTTLASSTLFNAVSVSDTTWNWVSPAFPPTPLTISLDDPNLVWQSIVMGQAASTAFKTTIPTAIPEPTTYALLGLGATGLMFLRCRRAKP